MTISDEELARWAERVAAALHEKSLMLACAESCTGGWVAKLATDLTGSSAWFECSFVTYSNEAKQALLGVSAQTLQAWGAVSEATVREMAAGALARSRAQVSVAISGIAGPGGGSPEKPVGLVWFAWGAPDGTITAASERFEGDRDAVRRQAVVRALRGVLDVVGG